ncbi:MAG: TlyA family RNA methyltransferase [Firmicutes bacterium]|nr:TlyA family RNA methyltransferase [Bacillota bacterium]
MQVKDRLDVILTEKGLFDSREKAKAAIMAGEILVDGQRIDKPGTKVDDAAEITVKEASCPYVSRGGLKLEKAIKSFDLDLQGVKAVDIGASTGGFTDCMLRNGADHVYCIDVGYGQLDWKLRNDPRITNMEKTNVRYLDVDLIGTDVDFISIDVSFISLKLVLPVAADLLREGGQIVSLVKPQFEAGREQVGKKGIVRDPAVHRQVIEQVIGYAESCGLCPEGLDFSPVTGTKGNIEYLLFMTKKLCNNRVGEDAVRQVVEASHEQL